MSPSSTDTSQPGAADALVTTACPLDCWDACSVIATVRDGRAVRLQGNKAHPITRGFLCARTVKYLDRVYSPDRLTRPLLRRDGSLRPVSWDVALETAARRLEEARAAGGPHAVLHYRSAGSMGLTKKLADRFWNLFGGVTELSGDFCLGAGKAALERHLGDYRAHVPGDLRRSRTIVLWGRDPFTSGPHVIPPLREAITAGGSVISINPTDLGHPDIVGTWVRLRPAGDAALALALTRVLIDDGLVDRAWIERHAVGFDAFSRSLAALRLDELAAEAGVPAARIREVARRLSTEGPTAILLGTGAIRYRLGLEAASAIIMLGAVLGTIGRPGGGVTFAARHARGLDLGCLAPDPGAVNREVPVSRLPELLPNLDPAVRVGWIESANPANAFGDRRGAVAALRAIPFLIVADFHRTMTTEIADLVLPVTSFVESDDVVPSWGHAYVAVQRAAISPLGEARDDLRIYQAVAERLGFGAEMAGDAESWCRRMLAPVLGEAGGWGPLDRDGFAHNPAHEDVPWADGRFATPSGKFEFEPGPVAWRRTQGPTAEHPLTLLTPKSAEHHLSQILPDKRLTRYQVRLHPAALASRGLLPGAHVRLRSSREAIPAVAVADPTLEEGVAVLPMSGWAADGNDVNLLTPPDTAADGITFAYYDCFVEVEADRAPA